MASESWARAEFRSLALSLVASILAMTSAADGCSSSMVVYSSAQGRPRKPEGTEPVSFGWVWLADNSNDMMVSAAWLHGCAFVCVHRTPTCMQFMDACKRTVCA